MPQAKCKVSYVYFAGKFEKKTTYSYNHFGIYYYGLNVCVRTPTQKKFVCWNLIPSVMVWGRGAFERWLGHEAGTLVNWITVLIKEPGEFPDPSPTSSHGENMAVYEQETDPHLMRSLAKCLDPASRTVRNKCVLFRPPNLWHFRYSSPNGLRHLHTLTWFSCWLNNAKDLRTLIKNGRKANFKLLKDWTYKEATTDNGF